MEAAELIRNVVADGLTLEPDGDRLVVTGDTAARSRWRESLVAYKPDVIRFLNDARRTALPFWRMYFKGSNPVEATFSPPVDRTEALRRYPGAIDAEPVDRCQACARYRRPGLSDGYCATRSDLPASGYALLRQLPDDRGAWCDHHTLSEAWK